MTNDPNTRQVGGDHYRRAGMQHWDLAALADAGYFAGQVTKYTERHSKKNGRQDLEKALHFAEKMHSISDWPARGGEEWSRGFSIFKRQEKRAASRRAVDPGVIEAVREYAVDAGLTAIQERIFELCFVTPHRTSEIVDLCQRHLEREYGPTLVQEPPPPPPMREGSIPATVFGEEGADFAYAPRQSSLALDPPGPGTPEDGGHHARAEAGVKCSACDGTGADLDETLPDGSGVYGDCLVCGGRGAIYPEEFSLPSEVETALTQDLQALIDSQSPPSGDESAAAVVAPFSPKRSARKRG